MSRTSTMFGLLVIAFGAVACEGKSYEVDWDISIDTGVDTAMDTAIDPGLDVTPEPTVDTAVDPTVDTAVDPTVDTAVDPTVDTAVDPTVDTAIDPGLDVTPEPTVDTIADPTVDTAVDPTPDAPCTVPPSCPTSVGEHEYIGQPCETETDCGIGMDCFTETTESFDADGDGTDETYVSWQQGACLQIGPGGAGCDPEDAGSCPYGSSCILLFTDGATGTPYYGCLDACSPHDGSLNPYDWNCGCRAGYACSITQYVCLPGCSTDEECCQVWVDGNGNGYRGPGEVFFDDDCTNWCDGDDSGEYPDDDCRASFQCINEGDPSADYDSECLFDSDCPPQARCLNEHQYADDDTGEPYYPGGMCIKDRCDLVGRGCDGAAECVNLGSPGDPFFACIHACQVGFGPGDPSNPCRDCAGSDPDCVPYTCTPMPPESWHGPGSTVNDGICLPAIITDPSGPQHDPGESCESDEECLSPLGLGGCYSFSGAPGLCGVQCNQELAEDHDICGAPETPGEEAPGVCWSGLCFAACDVPNGTVGSNGCPQDTQACFDNGPGAYGGYTHVSADGTPPAGFCFSGCLDSAWCNDVFGVALSCNPTTGQCGM